MAGGNPVFDRLNKQIEKERYAGFGSPQPQQGAQAATAGYATQDALSAQQLNEMYARQSAGPVDTGRVTLDDVVMKSLSLFVLLVASGAASWFLVDSKPSLASPLWLGGMLIGVALGFAIAFMKRVVVPLIAIYAIVEGVFLGAFSNVINAAYDGVVLMAVLATVCTFAGMYAAYATGLIKVNDRMRRMFIFLIIGYGLFMLLQFVLQMAGVLHGWGFGGSGGLGIGLSLLGTGLAAWSLAFDFDSIDRAVAVGAPRKYSWLLAHGLIVSVVWLYIEFVRLFARLRD